MEIPNIFNVERTRPDREKKLQEIRNRKYINPSSDFMAYGYDYFDNADVHSGYRYYVYDGRFEKPVNEMIRAFQLSREMVIADYGCAKGFMLYEFQKKGFQVLGFDRSEYAVNNAHDKIKSHIVQCEDPDAISNYKFDFFVCRNVLPHLDTRKIERLIRNAIHCTKQAPYFVIHSFENSENKSEYEYWDRTHKTVMTCDGWREFLRCYDNEILYSLDPLF